MVNFECITKIIYTIDLDISMRRNIYMVKKDMWNAWMTKIWHRNSQPVDCQMEGGPVLCFFH